MMLRDQIVVQGDWIIHDNPSHEQWYYAKEGTVHIKSLKGELLDSIKAASTSSGDKLKW